MDPDWNPLCSLKGKPKPEFEKYRKIKVLVDSGAAESVLPPDLLPDYVVKEGAATRNKIRYTTADGGELANLGEVDIPFRTKEGFKCGVKFQVCDVMRPLLAVSDLTAHGNDVDFNDSGGSITSQDGKQKIRFTKQDGVYILEMYVPPFQRQGA